jgi:beta-galactosidase
MTSRFLLGESEFLLDDAPHQILSGAIHYFRVHPDLWADRIEKARLLGLNSIETYVPWNDHEPQAGAWTAEGPLDLGRFLDLVNDAGMHAIVRPGPYICAEYDNGGLPAWLFTDQEVGIRRFEPRFMIAVESYLRRVYEIVAPRQIDHGGPVVLVQIENEYGAYGEDRDYLRALVEITRAAGIEVPLTTVDQPEPQMLQNGGLPELLKTASFGSRSRERLATLRAHQPSGPLMCSEYWNGWFDHWGGEHHLTSPSDQARDLDELLATGASVNLYMFHGGTNFGFTNGANDKGIYEPTVTSYDYDAPLDEAGDPTAKFFAFQDVFAKYGNLVLTPINPPEDRPIPTLRPSGGVRLLDTLDELGTWMPAGTQPALFDDIGHYRGFMALRTLLPATNTILEVGEVRDRAAVFVDGTRVGTLERAHGDRSLHLPAGRELTIVLEDQGRVNYDRRIGEAKGLIAPVTVDGKLAEWSVLAIHVENLSTLRFGLAQPEEAAVLRYEFDLEEQSDLFLRIADLGKGIALLNGFSLGRYWNVGPQRSLYVPGPATQRGLNELILFEIDGTSVAPRFTERASLGLSSGQPAAG